MKPGVVVSFIIAVVALYFIYQQVEDFQLQNDPVLDVLRRILKPVHPVFSKVKLYKADKSYTINKEKVFICLKDKNGDYYPINMLVYVVLHEIAHVLNKDIGHTESFHQVFDSLRAKAFEVGVFNPSIPIIQNYSGEEGH